MHYKLELLYFNTNFAIEKFIIVNSNEIKSFEFNLAQNQMMSYRVQTANGLIHDNDRTLICLSNYSSLEFVTPNILTSNILTSLQNTRLPLGIVIDPQGMGLHNMTPSPDKTMDCKGPAII